jgi:NitT/TauT family transport system substrate-binding protein
MGQVDTRGFLPKGNTVCCAVGLLSVLCGSPGWSAEQRLKPLVVGSIKIAAETSTWISQKRGIFDRNGLNVKFVEFTNGADAISASRSGSVDIVPTLPGTAMTANERGFDLAAIFQIEVAYDRPPDSGSVQVLTTSSVNSLAELTGKKIAVAALHTQLVVGLRMLLKKSAVDLGSLQFVEVPFPAQEIALKAKHVDAVVAVNPFTTQLLASGTGRVLSWNYVESIPGQPISVWFSKREFIKLHAEEIDGFARSIKESMDYLNEDSDRARDEVTRFTGLAPALVKSMPMVNWDYHVRREKWQAVADMMFDGGELRQPHRADEYFSDQIKSFIRE